MRWESLFADLQAQATELEIAERSAEVQERVRIELSQLALADRIRPAAGQQVRIRCIGELTVAGVLQRVGADWLLLHEGGGREALIQLSAVLALANVGRLSAPPTETSSVSARLPVGQVLRAIARDRSVLRLHLRDGGVIDGTIDRVGRDFTEIAVHAAGELRRRSEVREVLLVPHCAVAALRRDV